MPQEYTITAISQQPPREWAGKFGPKKTYKVKLEGDDRIVEINKNADSPMPKEGDKVYGSIEVTEYGVRFKTADRPGFSKGGGKSNYQPRDDAAIRAQWAIGQAVSIHAGDLELVEGTAKDLFAMVERIKSSGATSETTTQPVDLADIPF